MKQSNSNLVAVNPDTLEILDSMALPEPATVPHIITMFGGQDRHLCQCAPYCGRGDRSESEGETIKNDKAPRLR